MTEDAKQENENGEEPSIEEILSSIRDIISDEDEEGGEAAAADEQPAAEAESPVEEATPAEEVKEEAVENADDDALDLSEFAEEPIAEVEAEAAPEEEQSVDAEPETSETPDASEEEVVSEGEGEDPLAGIDFDHPTEDEVDMVDAEPEEPADDGVSGILEDEKDPLVDAVVETASVGAMAKLAENISLARTSDNVTLEDIVRELLRPMLKDWLDENLPTLIERLVTEELERLTEKAMRK